MKVGIIGAGAVGAACAKAMLLRGSCEEIVLLDKNKRRAVGVANDLSHGGLLCPDVRIEAGNYTELANASVVVITAGINEKAGKAIGRSDKLGRNRILRPNAEVYHDILPKLACLPPKTPILVVTDPPDPLADLARKLTKNPVLSTGTFLDTLRFRYQIARQVQCPASAVDAMVIGEHGLSQVYVWSSAKVDGELVLQRITREGGEVEGFRSKVESAVRLANIDIIEGTGASQHGIGIVTARIIEAILRDEGFVAPIGVWQESFNVTLSLPASIGRDGVSAVLDPELTTEETELLRKSAKAIEAATAMLE